jgi:hypothetical protein
MKIGATQWLLLVLVLLFSSHAIADKSRAGSVHGDVYTAPDKSFQFTIPKLIEPDTFVRDVRESADAFKVVMGDDLCRRLFVIRHERGRYADFDAFQQARLATMQIADADTSERMLAQGRAMYASGSMPQASVCVAMTFGDGGQMVPAASNGSDIGVIFLGTENAWYEFGYVVGEGGSFAQMYGLGDIEAELDSMLAGFRELGPRQVQKLPEMVSLIRFVDAEAGAQCKALGTIKGKSTSFSGTVDAHMNKAQAKLREEAARLSANAIVIRDSTMKSSVLTGYPFMALVGDALVCDEVPDYLAWEIHTAP